MWGGGEGRKEVDATGLKFLAYRIIIITVEENESLCVTVSSEKQNYSYCSVTRRKGIL